MQDPGTTPTKISGMAATLAAVLTIVIWAAAFPAIAVGVRGLGPIPLAAARFATAAAAFSLWFTWRRPRLPELRDLPRIVTCGAMGIALYNILLNSGERSVSPGAASFIVATQPVFAAALSAMLLKERFSALAWAGTLLSLAGVGVIAAHQPGGQALGEGALAVLGAAACSGAYFVLQRPLVLRYGAMSSAGMTIYVGALLLSPWLASGLVRTGQSPTLILVVLFLGLVAGVLGYVSWMVALAGLGAARAANLLFLMAPLATMLSIPLTGRLPSMATVGGGLLALLGVAIVNARPSNIAGIFRRFIQADVTRHRFP